MQTHKNTVRAARVANRRTDDADAFLREDGTRRQRLEPGEEGLAEMLGENFITSATEGGQNALDEEYERAEEEEVGGPFLLSTPQSEMAYGTDESNPPDATVEPLPLVTAKAELAHGATPMSKLFSSFAILLCVSATALGCNEAERQQREANRARAEANQKSAEARSEADKQQAEADAELVKARADVREWASKKISDYERDLADLQLKYEKKLGRAETDRMVISVRSRLDEARSDVGKLDRTSAQGLDSVKQELRDDFDLVTRSLDDARRAI